MIKKRIGALVVVLAILLTGCAKEAYIEDYTLNGTVSTLASEEFKGRLTGTEGNDKALVYIANRFEEIGLDIFNDSSYFHEYVQTIYDPEKQQHTFNISFEDGSSKECIYGIDYVDQLRVNNFDITCPITFDSTDEKLSEKIIVLDENDDMKDVRNIAKGVLVKRNEFFGTTSVRTDTTPIIGISKSLYEEIKNKKVKNINIKSMYEAEQITAKNAIGKIKGADSKKALVLSAHFDHVGWAGENIFYGAVDNASGIAVVLDVAERLANSSKDKQFNMDILICGFNGEEYGLKGSEAFVNAIKNQYDDIYNINIDCVGKKDGGKIALDNTSGVDNKLLDEVKKSLNKYELEFIDKYYGMSDHQSFIDNSLCGISIGQEELFSGNRIHSEKDSIENIDSGYLKKVSDAVYDFIINNDGSTFKLNAESHRNDEGDDISDETWKKIDQRAKEIREEKDLKYDEIVAFEFDKYICQISGNYVLSDYNEIKQYYSDMIIPKKLLEYEFEGFYINDLNTGMHVYYDKSYYKKELEKVYKRELKPEEINTIYMTYKNEDSNLQLYINIPFSNDNDSYYRFKFCDVEEVDIDRNKYSILKTKGKDTVEGIYREYAFNNKKYHVEIRKYDEVIEKENNNEFSARIYQDTKEEMIDAAKQIDIEKIIKGLGI